MYTPLPRRFVQDLLIPTLSMLDGSRLLGWCPQGAEGSQAGGSPQAQPRNAERLVVYMLSR